MFRIVGDCASPASLGLAGDGWHGGRKQTDDLQGGPDKSSRTRAEGLHLLYDVVWFPFEGSLLGSNVNPVVTFPVEKITFPFRLFSSPVRRGFDDLRPLMEGQPPPEPCSRVPVVPGVLMLGGVGDDSCTVHYECSSIA